MLLDDDYVPPPSIIDLLLLDNLGPGWTLLWLLTHFFSPMETEILTSTKCRVTAIQECYHTFREGGAY